MFPSKSDGMFVPESLIFRSDSNGEDLEGYAGAGLYDSITMDPTDLKKVDYNGDRCAEFTEVQTPAVLQRTSMCVMGWGGVIYLYASCSIQMLVRIAIASRSIDQVLYLVPCNSRNLRKRRYAHTAAAVARALKGSRPFYHVLTCQICRALLRSDIPEDVVQVDDRLSILPRPDVTSLQSRLCH